MLKFNQKITDYQYILSFDIAKHISGYSLTDIVNNKVICAGIIDTKKSKSDFIWDYFYTTILEIINSCADRAPDGKLLITKERLVPGFSFTEFGIFVSFFKTSMLMASVIGVGFAATFWAIKCCLIVSSEYVLP